MQDGKVATLRFRTMQSEAAFREFIEGEIDRRGGDTTADFNGSKVKLSSPPAVRDPSEPKSKPLISWRDSYWAWEDGILVFGDDDYVHQALTKTLDPHIRRGRGKDYYRYVIPSVIPESMKRALLRQFSSYVGVRMQKQDAEDAASHAVRKAFGQNALDTAKSLLFEVKDVVVDFRYPTATDPARGYVEVTCDPSSTLASLIRELRSRRGQLGAVPDNVPAALTVNMGLPEDFRAGMKALVSTSAFRGSRIGEALKETIEEGTIRCESWIDIESERAMIKGVGASAVSEIRPEALAAAVGGVVNDRGDAVVPIELPFFADTFGRQFLSAAVDENELRFCMSLDGAQAENQRTIADRSRQRANVLIHFEAALGDSENEITNSVVDQVLLQLEEMYQHWRLYSLDPLTRRLFFRKTTPSIGFTSVSAGERSAGDYTASCTLSAAQNGSSLRIDFRVGRELFGLLLARKGLTGRELRPTLRSQ